MRGLEAAVHALPGVDLEALDAAAALQRRTDRRYLVPVAALAEIIGALAPTHRALETGGRRLLHYESVYFDDPARTTLRAHAQGRRRRVKFRTRLYADTGSAFFEVKLKGRRGETVKRRLPHPPEAVATLTPAARAFLADTLAAYGLAPPAATLGPVLATRFRRVTLADLTRGERLTCDIGLEFEHAEDGRAALRRDLAVVETKSPAGRSVADRSLLAAGVRPVTFSKYAVGLLLTEPGVPGHRWRRVARTSVSGP